jgi:SET domain-containing protein
MTASRARRIAVRRSAVHGRGVFALRDIAADARIIQYRGDVLTWELAQIRYEEPADCVEGHTFFFDRGDGTVIDGGSNGNSARYINHGCDPNCEAFEHAGRVYIYAAREILAGTELLLDYQLQLDDPRDPELRRPYGCSCGAVSCRSTMLAP